MSARDRAKRLAPPRFPTTRARPRMFVSQIGLDDAFRLLDALAIMAPMAFAYQSHAVGSILTAPLAEAGPYFLAGFVFYFVLASSEVYRLRERTGITVHTIHLLSVCLAGSAAGLIVAALVGAGDHGREIGLGLAWAIGALLCVHIVGAGVRRRLRLSGALRERLVLIGATDTAARLIAAARESGEAEPVAVFHDKPECRLHAVSGVPVLGDVIDLLAWEGLPLADRIVICLDPLERTRIRQLIARIAVLPHQVSLAFETPRRGDARPAFTMVGSMPLASVSGITPNPRRAQVKRIVDLVVAAAALALLAPLFAIIALAIKLDSPGPALFVQRRFGLNNGHIQVFKFRTMRTGGQGEGDTMRAQVQASDPRVTAVGRFLRTTSLDELPQLINVLRGDMSLVGPRPHAVGMMVEGLDPFVLYVDYAYRHRVKPGLTGWAQVNGSRGPLEARHDLAVRLSLDLVYVRSMSLWFDLWILIRTLPLLFGDFGKTR